MFDLVLPSVICATIIAVVWLHGKFEKKVKSLFQDKELRVRDALLLIIAMGATVIAIVLIPNQAVQVLFLISYSFVLFLFTFIALERWFFAFLPSAVFIALYFSPFWNVIVVNLFALLFVASVSAYIGGLFSWITVSVFAAVVTIYDFIQVFGTRLMGASVQKLSSLRLPVLIDFPTFPIQGRVILGLGDIFLAGLLAIQTMKQYGGKAGILSAFSIGFSFFLYELAVFHYSYAGYFPATLVVVCGWILCLGLLRLQRRAHVSQRL